MRKLVTVYGMTCENCRKTIITKLESTEGVEKASVTMSSRLVEVDFDDKIITLNDIKKHIQKLGYDPM